MRRSTVGANIQEWMTIRFRTRSDSPGKSLIWCCWMIGWCRFVAVWRSVDQIRLGGQVDEWQSVVIEVFVARGFWWGSRQSAKWDGRRSGTGRLLQWLHWLVIMFPLLVGIIIGRFVCGWWRRPDRKPEICYCVLFWIIFPHSAVERILWNRMLVGQHYM